MYSLEEKKRTRKLVVAAKACAGREAETVITIHYGESCFAWE